MTSWKNKSGVGLTEVVVGIALLGLFSVALMKVFKIQNDQRWVAEMKSQVKLINGIATHTTKRYEMTDFSAFIRTIPNLANCFEGKGINCAQYDTNAWANLPGYTAATGAMNNWKTEENRMFNARFNLAGTMCAAGSTPAQCPILQVSRFQYNCPTENLCDSATIRVSTTVDVAGLDANKRSLLAGMPPLDTEIIHQKTKDKGLTRNISSNCTPAVGVNVDTGQLGCGADFIGGNLLFTGDLGFSMQNTNFNLTPGPVNPCPAPPETCPAGEHIVTDLNGCKRCIKDNCPPPPTTCGARVLSINPATTCHSCVCPTAPASCPDNSTLKTNSSGCAECACDAGFVPTVGLGGIATCTPSVFCAAPNIYVPATKNCCNPQNLPFNGWTDWTTCTKRCGNQGTQSATCTHDKEQYCDSNCNVGQTKNQNCNRNPCCQYQMDGHMETNYDKKVKKTFSCRTEHEVATWGGYQSNKNTIACSGKCSGNSCEVECWCTDPKDDACDTEGINATCTCLP